MVVSNCKYLMSCIFVTFEYIPGYVDKVFFVPQWAIYSTGTGENDCFKAWFTEYAM